MATVGTRRGVARGIRPESLRSRKWHSGKSVGVGMKNSVRNRLTPLSLRLTATAISKLNAIPSGTDSTVYKPELSMACQYLRSLSRKL